MVERLLPHSRVRGAWAATFLFPGIFLYDSSLGVAADHILAFWAIPIALTAFRFVIAWTPSRGVLLAAMLAGATMTKPQALYFLVPTALLVVGCAVLAIIRRTQRLGTLAKVLCLPTLGAFAVLSAAHWLANVIWYRIRLSLYGQCLPVAALIPGHAGYSFDPGWTPEGTLWQRVRETLLALFTFAYKPHDWPGFHRDLPVFGFLFTLSLLLLPFFPRARRAMLLALASLVGIAVWFWTYHQDRYLQTLLPWMVAVTVAAFTLAWRTGWPARAWPGGARGDATDLGGRHTLPSDPRHGRPAAQRNCHRPAFQLLFATRPGNGLIHITGFDEVREALPKDSVVLLHDEYVQLGIGRPVVSDNPRWEGGLDLGKVEPAQAFEQLRAYRVTHVLARPESLSQRRGVVGQRGGVAPALQHWGVGRRRVGWLDLWALPRIPQARSSGPIVYAGCGKRAQVGLDAISGAYEEDRRGRPGGGSLPAACPNEALFRGAQAAVIDERCPVWMPERRRLVLGACHALETGSSLASQEGSLP